MMGITNKGRKFYFFNNEDALVFAAKVNSRREAIGHYGRALVRTDISDVDVAFLSREVRRLAQELRGLLR